MSIMSTSMLNIRMPQDLKEAGEEVLHANGISATEAIRSFYTQLAKTQEVPTWIPHSEGNEIASKRKLLKQLSGTAPLKEGETLEVLREERLRKEIYGK